MASNLCDQSKHNIRLSDMREEPKRMLQPIQGFENVDIVSLEKSVEPLRSIVPQIDQMVYIVKQNSTNPEDNLSPDESGSIMLYSLEWFPRENSFYFILNQNLRSENRQLMKPWFLYLRLFSYSLSKLPSILGLTIYRGIKMDLSNDYPTDKIFVWWAFSSCTNKIQVLENEHFFGKNGKRTLFAIQCDTGKDIRKHSIYPTEDEILLFAARQFKVISNLDAGNGLQFIQIKEIIPPFPFISCSPIPTVSSSLTITSYQNRKLEDFIHQCQTSSEINLNQQNLTDEDMEIVVQQAIINKQCQKLLLENNQITSQGALTIANALNRNTHLEILILLRNQIADLGVYHLSKVLATHNSTLTTLGLGSNGITDNGLRHLAQIFKTNQSLTILGLVSNQITDQGIRFLADVLSHYNTNLQILYLSKNKLITDSSVDSLIQIFKRNYSLKELWIQNCNLSDNGKQKLRQITKLRNYFRLEF